MAIEREVAGGSYGSTQSNIGTPSTHFVPSGLVDCSAHPTVLLFGWAAPAVRATLVERGVVHRLRRATAPTALGLSPGALLYGPQTQAAEIIEPGSATEPLGVPPRHRACGNGAESVTYAFATPARSRNP